MAIAQRQSAAAAAAIANARTPVPVCVIESFPQVELREKNIHSVFISKPLPPYRLHSIVWVSTV